MDYSIPSITCMIDNCSNYRWSGCNDNLCPEHCEEEEKRKKDKAVNEWAGDPSGVEENDTNR